jgi:RNA polymerase sigma-70 factor, ECF subfamily
MEQPGRDLYRFDEAYVQRLRAGDADTERHFVVYFRSLLRIKLRSRLRSQALIDDACQETFLRVFKSLRSGEGIQKPERIGAYVNAVCDRVLLELYRSERRHAPPKDAVVEDIPDEAPQLEQALLDNERRALVRRTIAELPEQDRALMQAMFVEEQDKNDICERFNVDRDYLRVLLHRAKNRFRNLYLARTESAMQEGA